MPIETQSVVVDKKAANTEDNGFAPRSRFGSQERMFLTERLALLLETGNALHTSLQLVAAQPTSAALRRVVATLEDDVSSGASFSEALRRQPEAFPETYASLIAAAERGGFLPEVLARLLEMEEKRYELRSTLTGALTYPAFLICFSAAVVVFILVVVFPKFGDLFEMIADELPITTVVLMGASDLLRSYWIPLLVGLAASAALVWRWVRSPTGVEQIDRLSYRLPFVRTLVSELYLVQFLRTMALSLANGVPMLEALRACHTVVPSLRFRRFISGLEERVTEGQGVAVGFREASFLPALAGQMVSTGEESGRLALVMERVASFYERQWRKRLDTATKLIEPALLLIMGVVVGLIVSSLLLPIFKLSRAVG